MKQNLQLLGVYHPYRPQMPETNPHTQLVQLKETAEHMRELVDEEICQEALPFGLSPSVDRTTYRESTLAVATYPVFLEVRKSMSRLGIMVEALLREEEGVVAQDPQAIKRVEDVADRLNSAFAEADC